jgi:hypothetical protein
VKKFLIGGLAALALAGCGSTAVATNPVAQKDAAAAQTIVQGCVSHGNLLTHSGRVSIEHCIAPGGKAQEARAQACIDKAFVHGILTRGQRQRTEAALTVCVEKDR